MSDNPQPGQHKRGEHITVFWPGGPYDFDVEYGWTETIGAPGWEDWIVIHGVATPADGPRKDDPRLRADRSFYVKPVDGGYTLLPVKAG